MSRLSICLFLPPCCLPVHYIIVPQVHMFFIPITFAPRYILCDSTLPIVGLRLQLLPLTCPLSMFLYCAACIQSVFITQIALHFTTWQTCSFWHQLDFSEKHSSHTAITHEEYSFTFPPLSTCRPLQPSTCTHLYTAEWTGASFIHQL